MVWCPKYPRYADQSAELKHIRADDTGGQGRWSFSSQQATLRRLDKAFRAFFDRVKAGRTPGFPRFKGRGWFDSVDAGWGVFLTVLAHKAESAGRELIAVNPANTSRTCARCGHCAKENRVTSVQSGPVLACGK
jgi:transposase